MLDTILFDLDGTLAPFAQDEFIRVYFKALVSRVTPMGYKPDDMIDALWQGVSAMTGNDGSRTNRQIFWESFTQKLGIQALALENILNDFYAREFDSVRTVLRETADRGPLLRGLRERGYGLVLATNPIFPAVAVETRLGWVGLRPEDFDYVTTYENSRRSKPNPDYYRDILSHIGRQGENCLMAGNNPVDDAAALQAGISVYLVTDYRKIPTECLLRTTPTAPSGIWRPAWRRCRPWEGEGRGHFLPGGAPGLEGAGRPVVS